MGALQGYLRVVSEEPTEVELIEWLRAQQPGAFDLLYRWHKHRIWKFLRSLARSTTEAEDLFQETWVAAARHAHRLEVNSQLLPWLFTIARNKHRNALRFTWFEMSRRSAVMRTGPDYVESHEGVVAEREEAGLVIECFRDLPTAFRESASDEESTNEEPVAAL